jgi:hypothetical protein
MSLFRCLVRTNVSVHIQCFLCEHFVMIRVFCNEELLTPRPPPPAGGPSLVGCPRLLFQYIRSYPPYWRPLFRQHAQPEYAPCRGDRDPLIRDSLFLFTHTRARTHARARARTRTHTHKGMVWLSNVHPATVRVSMHVPYRRHAHVAI